jgi:hypothetical protein
LVGTGAGTGTPNVEGGFGRYGRTLGSLDT